MLKVLSNILCDLDPKVKVIGQKAGICDFCSSLCLVFVMLSRRFIANLRSPAGKWLTSWLLFVMFNCVFVTFSCGFLGQTWYLIVSIPDLCRLSYLILRVGLFNSSFKTIYLKKIP